LTGIKESAKIRTSLPPANMKNRIKATALAAAGMIVFFGAGNPAPAQSTVGVDPLTTWIGYMNMFTLPADGGAYVTGQVWPTVDLTASFSGDILTLGPTSINDPSPVWYIGGGAPGAPGNRIMDANFYNETTGVYTGQTLTFTGNVLSNTFLSGYTVTAFVKDFAPDYSSSINSLFPITGPGVFEVSLSLQTDPGRHVQYGFTVHGPNVWITDRDPIGNAQITAVPEPRGFEYILGAAAFFGATALMRRRRNEAS
jgi:hypothetical protein